MSESSSSSTKKIIKVKRQPILTRVEYDEDDTDSYDAMIYAAFNFVTKSSKGAPFAFRMKRNMGGRYQLIWATGNPSPASIFSPVTMILHNAWEDGEPGTDTVIYMGNGYNYSPMCIGMAKFAGLTLKRILGEPIGGDALRLLWNNDVRAVIPVDTLEFTNYPVPSIGDGPFRDLFSSEANSAHRIYMFMCYANIYKRALSNNGPKGSNIGAAIVSKEGKILSWALNTAKEHYLCHAETNAIHSLIYNLQDLSSLNDLIIYTTLKPCHMCAGVIAHTLHGKRYKVFYAVNDPSQDAKDTALDRMSGVQFLLDDIKTIITKTRLDEDNETIFPPEDQAFIYDDRAKHVFSPGLGGGSQLMTLSSLMGGSTSSTSSTDQQKPVLLGLNNLNMLGPVSEPQGQFPRYVKNRSRPTDRPTSPTKASISYQSYRLQHEALGFMVQFLGTKSGIRLAQIAVNTLIRLCSKYSNELSIRTNNPFIKFNPFAGAAIKYLAPIFQYQGLPFPDPIFTPRTSSSSDDLSDVAFVFDDEPPPPSSTGTTGLGPQLPPTL